MEFHSFLCFVEFIEVENLVSLPLHLLNNQTRVGDLVFIQDLSQRLSVARKPTLYQLNTSVGSPGFNVGEVAIFSL